MSTKKPLSLGLFLLAFAAGNAQAVSTLSTQGLWDDQQPGVPESIRVQSNLQTVETTDSETIVTEPPAYIEPRLLPFEYVRLSPVLFEHDAATLTAEGQQALEAAADYIKANPTVQRLLVDGNTDEVGTSNYNFKLSERRLKSVRAYLTLKGIAPELVRATGLGETTPIDENWTRVGRARNRQVSIYAVHLAR